VESSLCTSGVWSNVERLRPFVCCPECHGGLSDPETGMAAAATLPAALRQERVIGMLICAACQRNYPILSDGIPLLWSDVLRQSFDRQNLATDKLMATEHDVKLANARVYDHVAQGYDDARIHADPATFSRADDALRLCGGETRGPLLDVGCGPGNVLDAFEVRGYVERVGCDISLRVLRVAAAKGHAVALGDAEKLPFTGDRFTMITAYSVLHHLFAPRRLLTEARRVLVAGGVLLTDFDPNARAAQLRFLARALFGMRYFFFRLLPGFSRDPFHSGPTWLQHANLVAEFHNGPGAGFSVQRIRQDLRAAGLQPVGIFLHNNRGSALRSNRVAIPRWKHALLQLLSLRNPIARANAASIQTISRRP
jgi:ubiquinone/menaquinone biosynthesis C-methylase UbiE/uncharacterized protein YbaR (Trm112 family)